MSRSPVRLNHTCTVLAACAALVSSATALAQLEPPPLVQPPPATEPAPAPAPSPATTAPAATAPAEPAVQPFVGQVTADRVYVRSGPGVNYYEMGQLNKGDLVSVVGGRSRWYQIAPPAGTFALIAKEFVQVDPDNKVGTVKTNGDYVNVRAGSALQPNSSYAVLTVVKNGTKLDIVGSTDKHYKILPPDKAFVYISPDFVKPAPEGTQYTQPTLTIGGRAVATTAPSVTDTVVEVSPPIATTTDSATDTTAPATQTADTPTPATQTAGGNPQVVVVTPTPATSYAPNAYTTFAKLNAQTQDEMGKRLADQKLDTLLAGYKSLLETPNLPPSVKQGAEARVESLEKMLKLQKAIKSDDPADVASEAHRKAAGEEWDAIKAKIDEWERSGPLTAEGKLQTSTVVPGKYVLVNPRTGRVVAYLNPSPEIDLAKVLGSYVGVRGITESEEGAAVKTVKVRTVTLMAEPK